jgi:hypothetical protein
MYSTSDICHKVNVKDDLLFVTLVLLYGTGLQKRKFCFKRDLNECVPVLGES